MRKTPRTLEDVILGQWKTKYDGRADSRSMCYVDIELKQFKDKKILVTFFLQGIE